MDKLNSLILCLLLNVLPILEAQDRQPAYAGSFYPATAAALEKALASHFSMAEGIDPGGRVQTLIVPHAGYDYSGTVAASGYKTIPAETKYDNIFIIASSHRDHFSGASVYAAGDYITPLGKARVNRIIANELIDKHSNIIYRPVAHAKEHSIEVQLPFIQYHFQESPPIVPIVLGSSTIENARDLAIALLPYFRPENLFVISSDFSHYPSYTDAQLVDRLTCEAILSGDPAQFYNTLRKNSQLEMAGLSTPSCGWASIMTMLYMADKRRDMEISPVMYRNSGDASIGDRNRVVGYWAIAGHIPDPGAKGYHLDEGEKAVLLKIARQTLKEFVRSGTLATVDPSKLTPVLRQPAGAFVSLYAGERLRGCIGNFDPGQALWQVVQEMTVAAASKDPRFSPVEVPELPYISIEISVLTPLRKIESIEEFELGRHGIYMKKDGRSGTFLPQVAESSGWNREEFLEHCANDKAGIGREGWKTAELFVYEAIVFGEGKMQ